MAVDKKDVLMGGDILQRENMRGLVENPYPGRLIVVGRIGETAVVQLYVLMGRDPKTSGNRVLKRYDNVIRSERYDKSQPITPEKLALIEYNALRETGNMLGSVLEETKPGGKWHRPVWRNVHVVTNGDQTDTIVDHIGVPEDALLQRTYEPDSSNTPRISATIETETGSETQVMISIIRRGEQGATVHQFHRELINKIIEVGSGLCVHTYLGDGDPPPSFNKDPYKVWVGQELDETVETYWSLLDPGNSVAIAGKSIDTCTGKTTDYYIKNKLG